MIRTSLVSLLLCLCLNGCSIIQAFGQRVPSCNTAGAELVLDSAVQLHNAYRQCASGQLAAVNSAQITASKVLKQWHAVLIRHDVAQHNPVFNQDAADARMILREHLQLCLADKPWQPNLYQLYWGEMRDALQLWYANEAKVKNCEHSVIPTN